MAATYDEIKGWLTDAQKDPSNTHLVVVHDSLGYHDYPVKVRKGQDIKEIIAKYEAMEMYAIMEIYDLDMDMEVQLKERRAYHIR